ncbi:MAG: hypothetical protein HFE84_04260 [Lachnospiraceae bacterium]|nr:hypothetical protein [Lachnospiraceae bacterium]
MFDWTELYYFSPTGGTKKAGMIFCEGIAKNVRTVDMGIRGESAKQPESELPSDRLRGAGRTAFDGLGDRSRQAR